MKKIKKNKNKKIEVGNWNNFDSYDDNEMLVKGVEYTVGTNTGREFNRVFFKGTRMYRGKPMMCFETQNSRGITINPSYHSFTIEEHGAFPMPSDLNYKEEDNNGKTNTKSSR